MQNKIREAVRRLLDDGTVKYFIGWGETRFNGQTAPRFIFKAEDADQLVYNNRCVNMIAKYLLDDRYPDGKVGLLVRGCESRAVNRMLKDGQIKRENLYLLGIPCGGMVDDNGKELQKCRLCYQRNPVVFDEMLGSPVAEKNPADRFADVEKLENMDSEERYDYWAAQFDKCIRCYACRNVCPACSCLECFVDQHRTGWQGKSCSRSDNQLFGLTRAYHVGDRCIECGECERVCPAGLPLMILNRKLIKDVTDMFGDYRNGMDDSAPSALGEFRKDDMEEFM